MKARQGEIYLKKVNQYPSDYVKHPVLGSALLGVGETGNAHVLTPKKVDTAESTLSWLVDAIDDINEIKSNGARAANGKVFVDVPFGGTFSHSDPEYGHGVIDVEPGVYEVKIKKEHLPWEEQARFVAD